MSFKSPAYANMAMFACLFLAPCTPVHAATDIQMLPPTLLNSNAMCGKHQNQVLVFSGTQTDDPTGAAGINCAPITLTPNGDLTATGSITADKNFIVNGTAATETACDTPGTIARDAIGKLLSCQTVTQHSWNYTTQKYDTVVMNLWRGSAHTYGTTVKEVDQGCAMNSDLKSDGGEIESGYNLTEWSLTCGKRFCSNLKGYTTGNLVEAGSPGEVFNYETPYQSPGSIYVAISCLQ